jgi:hypothetical protein
MSVPTETKSPQPTTTPEKPVIEHVLPEPTPYIREFKITKANDMPMAKIKGKDIKELSGIVPAGNQGEYWGHNDRGNDPEIYRFNRKGKILQQVKLEGIPNDDWECITRDAQGNLYIGATGDNDKKKETYHIYQLEEPKRESKRLATIKTHSFVYSGGKSHNCEAFFLFDGKFYLITKENDNNDKPVIFCLDSFHDNEMATARKLGKFNCQGKVTDASYSQTHQLLAVLTYSQITLYRVTQPQDLFTSPLFTIDIDLGQSEGICFDGDVLIITNESGEFWNYSIRDIM